MKLSQRFINTAGVVILLVVVGIGSYMFAIHKNKDENKVRQAVFLDNGQVYFGYVTKENKQNIVLESVYYLQVQEPLQPADENQEKSQEEPNVSLVKLGDELHGPTDRMHINRDHITFIEDMKSDSKVNQAIADYAKNGIQAQATPSTQPVATETPSSSPEE